MEKNRSLTNLTFETFSLLFPELADDKLWTKYYTVKVWNSVGARMAFTNPDIKPLPNVIGIASTQSIAKASSKLLDEEVKVRQPLYADDDEVGEADWVVVEKDVSEKSREYIELRRALILGDIKEITQFNEANNAGGGSLPTAKILEPTTHARLLYTLFVIFSANSVTPSAAASEAFSVLTGPKILGLTQTAFWIRIFTAAFMRMRRDGHASVNKDVGFDPAFFTDLLVQHPQLMFEDLWTKYYSREVWESYDAKVGLVEMDRGKLEGFLGPWARRDVK
jgi:ubiquitin carboxyl-terminal hydrolase L3